MISKKNRKNKIKINAKVNKKSNEKGSVLPFIAICLILIMSALALVFDFGAMVTTKSDLRDTARASAISALQAYIQNLNESIENGADPNDAQTYINSSEVAREQASAVANLNLLASPSSELRDGEAEGHGELANSQISATGGGFIQFGRWNFIEPENGIRPPCSPADQPFQPCFDELGNQEAANAIRVTLTDQNNRVGSIFSDAAGLHRNVVGDFGTAAFVPRQGVVAFDLSASVTRSSHLGSDRAEGRKSEYAFYLDPENLAGVNCGSNFQTALQDRHLETLSLIHI